MPRITKVNYKGTEYDIGAIDPTLTQEGQAADAKETGDEIGGLNEGLTKSTGNKILNNWQNSAYYKMSTSVTSVDINTPVTGAAASAFKCLFVACQEGDVFYLTATGNSTARPYAFLSSASGEDNIIAKASSNEYKIEDYRLVAPVGSAYAVFNANTIYLFQLIQGEFLKTRVENVEDEIIDISDKVSAIGSYTALTSQGALVAENVLEVQGAVISGATSAVIKSTQLFEPKLPTVTSNGVTVRNNGDGTFMLNGTATASSWFFLNQSSRTGHDNLLQLNGTYTLSYEVIGGVDSSLIVALRDAVENANVVVATNNNKSVTGSVSNNNIAVAIQTITGITYSNQTIRITLNEGSKRFQWTAYKTPQTIVDFTNLTSILNSYRPSFNITVTPTIADISLNVVTNGLPDYIEEDIQNATIYQNPNIICANHRGYHDGYPENTLWAFAQSKLRGFEYIENDVRFTSDGVGVLLHDETINRTARNTDGTEISETINIADITYAQACEYDFGIYAGSMFSGTKIVTVEECIAFCKNVGLKILMEPKVAGSGTYCANLVKKYAMEDNVIWISFGAPLLQEVNAIIPDATVGYVTTATPDASHVTTAIGLKTTHNKVFLDFDYRNGIDSVIDGMIENGVGYGVYTLDDPSALDNLNPYCFLITSNTLLASRRIAKDVLTEWTHY